MPIQQIAAPSLRRCLSNLMMAPSSARPETHAAGLTEYRHLGGDSVHLHGEGGETHSRRETGKWLAENHLRPEFFLCAQICHDKWNEESQQEIGRFTPDALHDDISTDLELIDTDYVDLIYFDDRPDAPLEPVLDAIFAETNCGRVRGFGVRNMTAGRIREANAYAAARSAPGVSAVITTELTPFRPTQPLWPGYTPFDAELRGVVEALNLTVFAHAGDVTLGQCLFGDEDSFARMRPEWTARWNHPANAAIADNIRKMAAVHGRTTREILLSWLLNQPFPVVAIVGNADLSAEGLRRCEGISGWRFSPAEREILRCKGR